MHTKIKLLHKLFITAILTLVIYNSYAQVSDTNTFNKTIKQPKLIFLNLDSTTYQRVLSPPNSVGIHSGLVTLKPGETVGHHNTDDYEEVLVIFSGEGQMSFEGGLTFPLKFGEVAYCPPHTEHDVKNTGTVMLKYLYIATNTKNK